MASADDAIKMLQDILLMDHKPMGVTLEYVTPAESMRRMAYEMDSKDALRQRAWEMVRSHKSG